MIARTGGRLGFGDRTATMRALLGDALPDAVLLRESKAEFGQVFWGVESRAFTEDWNGTTGVDPDLVDADLLRAAWKADNPDFRSAMLLQTAWLASRPDAG